MLKLFIFEPRIRGGDAHPAAASSTTHLNIKIEESDRKQLYLSETCS